MFAIFKKRYVLVEYKETLSLYDSFEKVKNDNSLMNYVSQNMKLKSGTLSNKVVLCSDGQPYCPVTLYSITKDDIDKLPEEIKSAVSYFFSVSFFDRKHLNKDIFKAYSFRIN